MAALFAVAVLALAVALLDLLLILGIVRRLRGQIAAGSPSLRPELYDIGSGPARGSKLREFSVALVGGAVFDNSRFAGETGCLAFVSASCLPCKGALSDLDPYLREAGIDASRTLVVIEDDAAAQSRETARATEFAEVVTGEQATRLVQEFGITGFPTMLIVTDGVVTANAPVVVALPAPAAAVAPTGR